MFVAYRLCLLAALLLPLAPANAAVNERAVSLATKGGRLQGTFYTPSSQAPVSGILLLHTAGGLSEADRIYARRLVDAGFAALVVSYRIGWAAPVNQGLATAVDWLRKQPETRNRPVGVVGFSLGGSKALLVAALRPDAVKAVVSYYGTYNVQTSKFADAVRQAQLRTGLGMPSPVQEAAKIGGAVLLLQGGNDDETSPEQTREMTKALDKAKKNYALKIYPGAVHMFERDSKYHPPGGRTRFGTVTRFNQTAADESWKDSLAWFQKYLTQ